jgi:hypothetical protein
MQKCPYRTTGGRIMEKKQEDELNRACSTHGKK